jgi:hypothetical protein
MKRLRWDGLSRSFMLNFAEFHLPTRLKRGVTSRLPPLFAIFIPYLRLLINLTPSFCSLRLTTHPHHTLLPV